MKRHLLSSLLPTFVLACGGAATQSPSSTTAATSASAAPSSSASTASSASEPSATPTASAPYSSAVLAISDPADPDNKAKSLHIEVPSGATMQVAGTTVNVLAGPHFAMGIIERGGEDLHEIVKAFGTPQGGVENAHVEKIKDDVLVYTGTELGGRAGYHFEAFVQTANPTHDYACGDSGLLKVELTRADVDAMIRACRTLKR